MAVSVTDTLYATMEIEPATDRDIIVGDYGK
jgi:hypothetical protein